MPREAVSFGISTPVASLFGTISFDIYPPEFSFSVPNPVKPKPPQSKNLIPTKRIATENIFRYNRTEKGFEVALEGHEIFLIKYDLWTEYFYEFFVSNPYNEIPAARVVLEHREANSYEKYKKTLTKCGKLIDETGIAEIRNTLREYEKELKTLKPGRDRKRRNQIKKEQKFSKAYLKSMRKKNGQIRDLDDLVELTRISFYMAASRALEKYKSVDEDLYNHFKECMKFGRKPRYNKPTEWTWNTTEVSYVSSP